MSTYKASASQSVPAVLAGDFTEGGDIVVRLSVEYPEAASRFHLTDTVQSVTDTLIFSLTGEAPQ